MQNSVVPPGHSWVRAGFKCANDVTGAGNSITFNVTVSPMVCEVV